MITDQQTAVITEFMYYFARNRGGVRYSMSRSEYIWNSNGRTVSPAKIQNELDKLVDGYYDNVRRLGERLDNGNLTVAQWQGKMRQEIKEVHRRQYIIGRGGREAMTQRDWGRLGSDLRWMQYGSLDGFALDIADEKLSLAQIQARAKMYVTSSNKQFWRGRIEAKKAAGFVEEQRFLNPAEHCDDCIGYAGVGRVPIGTLPEPGEKSECRANCKCEKRYYGKPVGQQDNNAVLSGQPLRFSTVQNAFDEFGGSTHGMSGRNFIGSQNYAIGGVVPSGIIKGSVLDKEKMRKFMNKNQVYFNLQNDTYAIGTWYNEEDDNIWLDVSQVVSDREEALAIARARGEIAIFDLDNIEEIFTGGIGTKEEDG